MQSAQWNTPKPGKYFKQTENRKKKMFKYLKLECRGLVSHEVGKYTYISIWMHHLSSRIVKCILREVVYFSASPQWVVRKNAGQLGVEGQTDSILFV